VQPSQVRRRPHLFRRPHTAAAAASVFGLCVSAAAAASAAGLPDELYNAVMTFEPNALEIAMAELRRVLRAEARHASKMRKRAGKLPFHLFRNLHRCTLE